MKTQKKKPKNLQKREILLILQQIKRKNDGKGKYKLKCSASCGRFQDAFPIPWDHHRRIIDKCKGDMDKALFFVRKTWENNWGRDALLNWLIPTFMSVTAKPSQTSNPRSLLCRVT